MLVVITGANRGIGLGLAQKYLSLGYTVWAGCRNPDGARDLWELERDFGDRFKFFKLDVTNADDISALKEKLNDKTVDVLINNAGVLPDGGHSLSELTPEMMIKAFSVNVLGATFLCQALLPNLSKSKKAIVVNMTSKMGSVQDNTSGGYYAYRTSKAALNMINKSFAIDNPSIISIVMHPGWVQTEMGGNSAPTTVEQSVDGIYEQTERLTLKSSGQFIDFKGKEIPW